MNAKEDLRLIRFRDAFQFSLAFLERAAADLEATRTRLSFQRTTSLVLDPPDVLRAIGLVWELIDNIHRVRAMGQAVPGLSGRDLRLRRFLAETELAEQFRHYVQHLREELAKPDIGPFPVWGSLSWVDTTDNQAAYMALTGTVVGETTYSGCPYDREERRWVGTFALTLDGASFNVDPHVTETASFCRYVLDWIASTFSAELPSLDKIATFSVRAQAARRDPERSASEPSVATDTKPKQS